MELVFELLNAKRFVPMQLRRKLFGQTGGTIGRHEDCDWVIPDSKRHLSNRHAVVSYQEGLFFLTDISSNGITNLHTGSCLPKQEPVRIEDSSVYVLGNLQVRAKLVNGRSSPISDAVPKHPDGYLIPDDAFMGLGLSPPLEPQTSAACNMEAIIAPKRVTEGVPQCADYARIETEHLIVPNLAPPANVVAEPELMPKPVEPSHEVFWQQFAGALGVDLQGFDQDAREAFALKIAHLLRQSLEGLQQNLRTRSELKNELRLAQTLVRGTRKSALELGGDINETLHDLLQPCEPGQVPVEQAVSLAFRDLQAHQVALLAASRAAVRGTLEHFSPQHLTLRFERDHRSLLSTAGSYWRAYGRYHQALTQSDDWSERLLARDFAQAYEEQVRLISTLYIAPRG